MAQSGYIYEENGNWKLRYRMQKADGKWIWAPVHTLASMKAYPKKSEVKSLRDEFMSKQNKIGFQEETGISVSDFVMHTYFPLIEKRLAPSTVKGYKDAWRVHLEKRIGGRRVRDVRTMHVQEVMDEMEEEHGKDLAHDTYQHAKVTLSAIFSEAKRRGLCDANPVEDARAPEGKPHGRARLAYSLEEEGEHIRLFTDMPVVQGIIGVASFAALRKGEIGGLWRTDDLGEVLHIQRSMWHGHLKDTKTAEDEFEPGLVPIIAPLRRLLDGVPAVEGNIFMFANTWGGSLNLDNLASRIIKPRFKANGMHWKGWQAYRRGLSTVLKRLHVDDLVIQQILRHESVLTTQGSYIKMISEDAMAAMKQLEEKIACTGFVQ